MSTTATPTGRRADTGMAIRVLPDVMLFAVSLATGLGLARLSTAPTAWRVVGPVIATVAAGHLTTSLVRRLRAPVAVAGACGVVAVTLSTLWGQFLAATRGGIPTAAAWHAVGVRLEAGYRVIRSHPTPVPATAGVVLWVAAGAGLGAVLTRTVWAGYDGHRRGDWRGGRTARPLLALVPSFGLFAYTALLSSEVDRVQGTLAYVVSALAFVVVADAVSTGVPATDATGTATAGADRRTAGTRRGRAALPSAGTALLAVVVPLALSPVLGALRVDAVPFPTAATAGGLSIAPTGPGGGAGARSGLGAQEPFGVQAINLVDNLQAVIVSRSDEVMFSAATPQPSYWQVAVLTLFNGTAWLPDPHTETAVQSIQVPVARGSTSFLPVLPQPRPDKTFRTRITINDLESTLLPLPSTVVSVDSDATYLADFGAVRSYETSTGYTYTADAAVPVSAAAPAATSVSRALQSGQITPDELDPYLQIPALSGRVVDLAHQIVSGAGSPAVEAADLARWFNSGRFRYTLTPPPSTGSDPLSSFLFTTRAGFCQQFAAAYAVLARIDGLPTRIAVGFTTGTPTGSDRYQVTGADAHVWPEVYLGPAVGWASFEPTPATTGEPTGVGVDSGAHATKPGTATHATASTASTVTGQRHPASSATSVPTSVPGATRRGAPGGGGATTTSGSVVWVVGILLALGAVGGGALVLIGTGRWAAVPRRWRRWRRHRRHPSSGARRHRLGWLGAVPGLGRLPWLARARRSATRAGPDPTTLVLAHYDAAADALDRARLGRRPAETIDEHVRRLESLAGAKWLIPYAPAISATTTPDVHAVEDAVDAYGRLAALAARASYGPAHCTPADAAEAERLGLAVEVGLETAADPRRRSRTARMPVGV